MVTVLPSTESEFTLVVVALSVLPHEGIHAPLHETQLRRRVAHRRADEPLGR